MGKGAVCDQVSGCSVGITDHVSRSFSSGLMCTPKCWFSWATQRAKLAQVMLKQT